MIKAALLAVYVFQSVDLIPQTGPCPTFPQPWSSYNGYCYIVATAAGDQQYADALGICDGYNATLVTLADINEMTYLVNNLFNGCDIYWLCYSPPANTTHYCDGTPYDSGVTGINSVNDNDTIVVSAFHGGICLTEQLISNLNKVACKKKEEVSVTTETVTTSNPTTTATSTDGVPADAMQSWLIPVITAIVAVVVIVVLVIVIIWACRKLKKCTKT